MAFPLHIFVLFIFATIIASIFIARRIVRKNRPLPFAILGVQLTILGIFLLVLWKWIDENFLILLGAAIFFSMLGTVLCLMVALKKDQ